MLDYDRSIERRRQWEAHIVWRNTEVWTSVATLGHEPIYKVIYVEIFTT